MGWHHKFRCAVCGRRFMYERTMNAHECRKARVPLTKDIPIPRDMWPDLPPHQKDNTNDQ